MDDAELYRQAREQMDAGNVVRAADLFAASVGVYPHVKALELWGECLLGLGHAREAVVPLAAAAAGRQDTATRSAFGRRRFRTSRPTPSVA